MATREIALTNGGSTIVDECDSWLLCWKWRLGKNGYARRNFIRGRKQLHMSLHRVIACLMGLQCLDKWQRGMPCVDHVNGNKLDNRRCNLRIASSNQNYWNRRKPGSQASSKLKGVTWHAQCGKWQAAISINGRSRYLGLFSSENDAHAAYATAAKQLHGQFANLGGHP